MSEEVTTVEKRKSYIWVRDSNGNTYLCPKGSLKDPKNFTEEELKECVDESYGHGEGG
jgi:hypothetical protein